MKSCPYLWPERPFEFGSVFCVKVFSKLALLFFATQHRVRGSIWLCLAKPENVLGNNDEKWSKRSKTICRKFLVPENSASQVKGENARFLDFNIHENNQSGSAISRYKIQRLTI